MNGASNLLIGLVLTERIDRPDRGGNPANQRDLKKQANDAGGGEYSA